MEDITVGIKALTDTAVIPSYAYEGDAGMDLVCDESVSLAPFERKLVSTGIAIELPEGFAALVLPRSGLAIKKGLSIVNAPGLIDSNYRGEVKVIAINLDATTPINLEKGERIAQMMIVPANPVQLVTKTELSDTTRGTGGFGSSGTATSC